MVRLAIRPEVLEDLKRVPRLFRHRVIAMIKRIEQTPEFGLPLDYLPSVGNLGDCRKIYVGATTETSPEYRIVYRLLPDESNPKIADVISVGSRGDYEAYKAAVERLGRM